MYSFISNNIALIILIVMVICWGLGFCAGYQVSESKKKRRLGIDKFF